MRRVGKILVNDEIEAASTTNGKWKKGDVTSANKNGSYDVWFDDGSERKGVPKGEIRFVSGGGDVEKAERHQPLEKMIEHTSAENSAKAVKCTHTECVYDMIKNQVMVRGLFASKEQWQCERDNLSLDSKAIVVPEKQFKELARQRTEELGRFKESSQHACSCKCQ